LVTDSPLTISPFSEKELLIQLPKMRKCETIGVVEACEEEKAAEVAKALVTTTVGPIPVQLLNTADGIRIPKGRKTVLEPIDSDRVLETVGVTGERQPISDKKKDQLWKMVQEARYPFK